MAEQNGNGNGRTVTILLAVATLLLGFILGDGLASYSVETRLNLRIDREAAQWQREMGSLQRQLDSIVATQRDILKEVKQ